MILLKVCESLSQLPISIIELFLIAALYSFEAFHEELLTDALKHHFLEQIVD
jgi:hypothetical protein